jgi:hypothetical protein
MKTNLSKIAVLTLLLLLSGCSDQFIDALNSSSNSRSYNSPNLQYRKGFPAGKIGDTRPNGSF